MKIRLLILTINTLFCIKSVYSSETEISRIAFGSCAKMKAEQTIWSAITDAEPQLWIWLGDNIYGDTANMEVMAAKYAARKSEPGYRKLRQACEVIGTWDDHDYGLNNGGKEFSAKADSQQAMLDFLDEPNDSPRRNQEGVYWSYTYGQGDRTVKAILLDARYHRDHPKDPKSDILGDAQWNWLKQELRASKAAIHLIASSIQIIPEEHKYEKWANFPQARERLYTTIAESGAKGVIFLSGDRHIAEISKEQPEGLTYPLYEITSSSLTHSWTGFSGEPNQHRIGEVFFQNNFGFLEIDWESKTVKASIIDQTGTKQRSVSISF